MFSFGKEVGGRFSLYALARELLLRRFAAETARYDACVERWLQYYKDFVHDHAGEARQIWYDHYALIEEEWENIMAVCQWCWTHRKLEDLWQFWQRPEGLDTFTRMVGHWWERMDWLDRIAAAARGQGEMRMYANATTSEAYALATVASYSKASEKLALVEELAARLHPIDRVWLSQTRGIALSWQGYYPQAIEQLRNANNHAAHVADPDLRLREQLINDYHIAETLRRMGESADAYQQYLDVVDRAGAMKWLRAVAYARNGMAHIATAQGRFGEAENHLKQALEWAVENHDRRREAFVLRAYAQLELRRQRLVAALDRCKEARDIFADLRMNERVSEMDALQRELYRQISSEAI
jgi:tetratricopeptide (TPR) repeat protein